MDLAVGYRFEVVGDRMEVLAVHEGVARFDNGPGFVDECVEGGFGVGVVVVAAVIMGFLLLDFWRLVWGCLFVGVVGGGGGQFDGMGR